MKSAKRPSLILGVCFFSLFVLNLANAQSPTPTPSLNNSPDVHPLTVQIDANGDELNNLVKSYLSRELRSLKDVTVNVVPQPTFVISCVCAAPKINGIKVGYAVSFVITSNLKPLKYIAAEYKKTLDSCPEAGAISGTFLTTTCRLTQQFEDHELLLFPTDQLKDQCASFVADFDTKYLEPLRYSHN